MNLSYEYIQFLNEKVLQYLPKNYFRVGNKLNFRCPLCGDSKKSSRKRRGWYYLDSASYYCFNCSTGMSGINFLKVLSGEDYDQIRKEYVKLFFKSNSQHSSFPKNKTDVNNELFFQKSIINPDWKNPLTKDAVDYLEKRKVLDAPFLHDNLYSCFNAAKQQEFILIPWILNGVESYYQINDFKKYSDLKYIFPKGKQKTLAGLDNIDLSWPYIICFEGFYDSVFVKNGICVGTKALSEHQEKLIKLRYPNHQIVLSFDNDVSGLSSIVKTLRTNTNYKYFKWFDSSIHEKDINERILKLNDVNIFADAHYLESMIFDRLSMKLQLIQNGKWCINTDNQ